VESNAAAAGVKLDAEVLARIDEALGDLPESDPTKTQSPPTRIV
ncbi:aldo/keto reductase, partial [Burkholderia multivorans]